MSSSRRVFTATVAEDNTIVLRCSAEEYKKGLEDIHMEAFDLKGAWCKQERVVLWGVGGDCGRCGVCVIARELGREREIGLKPMGLLGVM